MTLCILVEEFTLYLTTACLPCSSTILTFISTFDSTTLPLTDDDAPATSVVDLLTLVPFELWETSAPAVRLLPEEVAAVELAAPLS